MSDLVELYCSIDDFWKFFKNEWDKHLIDRTWPHGPDPELSTPEMMTIIVLFHQSNFRNFKHFYCDYVFKFLRKEFPKLISYSRFVYLTKNLFVPLFAFVLYNRGKVTGIAFVDSTKIQICHNKRIPRNKVFAGWAKRGRTTAGWFYGFKLHLIINEVGEILAFQFTAGNEADISVLDQLSQGIIGKLFGDKGYISAEIAMQLFKRGLRLFTTIRNKMKNKLMSLKDKILLRKRVLVETVNDQLKNISQLEHTRHRSVANFFINALAAIAAYMRQPKKPHINLGASEVGLVMHF